MTVAFMGLREARLAIAARAGNDFEDEAKGTWPTSNVYRYFLFADDERADNKSHSVTRSIRDR
jgi:hypothetical protein